MKYLIKIKKLLFGYPFLLGLLTSILINFGGIWIVKVRELTISDVSYTIVAKSSNGIANSDKDSNNSDGNLGPML